MRRKAIVARKFHQDVGERYLSMGFTVWFTGLPSAGKTTLARLLEKALTQRGCRVEVLDGDEVRQRLSQG